MTLLTFTDLDLDNDEAMKRAQRLFLVGLGSANRLPLWFLASYCRYPGPLHLAHLPASLVEPWAGLSTAKATRWLLGAEMWAPSHLQEKVSQIGAVL